MQRIFVPSVKQVKDPLEGIQVPAGDPVGQEEIVAEFGAMSSTLSESAVPLRVVSASAAANFPGHRSRDAIKGGEAVGAPGRRAPARRRPAFLKLRQRPLKRVVGQMIEAHIRQGSPLRAGAARTSQPSRTNWSRSRTPSAAALGDRGFAFVFPGDTGNVHVSPGLVVDEALSKPP